MTASSPSVNRRRSRRKSKGVACATNRMPIAFGGNRQDHPVPASLSVSINPPTIPCPPADSAIESRRHGKCSQCMRIMSLTAAGVLHSHGPGCSGSGQAPIAGSTSTSKRRPSSAESTVNSKSTAPRSWSSPDILNLLRERRCRVLTRIPKASRSPAAEKLTDTLGQVVRTPDCVERWVDLMSFAYTCFRVPGQCGGK